MERRQSVIDAASISDLDISTDVSVSHCSLVQLLKSLEAHGWFRLGGLFCCRHHDQLIAAIGSIEGVFSAPGPSVVTNPKEMLAALTQTATTHDMFVASWRFKQNKDAQGNDKVVIEKYKTRSYRQGEKSPSKFRVSSTGLNSIGIVMRALVSSSHLVCSSTESPNMSRWFSFRIFIIMRVVKTE